MIHVINAKYAGNCASCGERWKKFEKMVDVVGVRGENYCPDCLAVAKENNPEHDTDDDGLVTVPGDNRRFARTANGLRAGFEHTGQRCEDAPCCGCCG